MGQIRSWMWSDVNTALEKRFAMNLCLEYIESKNADIFQMRKEKPKDTYRLDA